MNVLYVYESLHQLGPERRPQASAPVRRDVAVQSPRSTRARTTTTVGVEFDAPDGYGTRRVATPGRGGVRFDTA